MENSISLSSRMKDKLQPQFFIQPLEFINNHDVSSSFYQGAVDTGNTGLSPGGSHQPTRTRGLAEGLRIRQEHQGEAHLAPRPDGALGHAYGRAGPGAIS